MWKYRFVLFIDKKVHFYIPNGKITTEPKALLDRFTSAEWNEIHFESVGLSLKNK